MKLTSLLNQMDGDWFSIEEPEKCVVDDFIDCSNCGFPQHAMMLVDGSSFLLVCGECHSNFVATSFIAVGPKLEGTYKAISVDENLRQIELLAHGKAPDIFDKVRSSANEGARVMLQRMEEK